MKTGKITIVVAGACMLVGPLVWGGSAGKPGGWDTVKYYAGHCSGCHGKDGRGNPRAASKLKADLPAMDFQGDEARSKTEKEFSEIILKGEGKMPTFGKVLTGAQAGQLAKYARKLGEASPAKTDAVPVPQNGQALFSGRSCSNCHGRDGKGVVQVAKMLKTDPKEMDLTGESVRGKADAVLEGIITAGAGGGKMPAYGTKMTKDEIKAVVLYIRKLK